MLGVHQGVGGGEVKRATFVVVAGGEEEEVVVTGSRPRFAARGGAPREFRGVRPAVAGGVASASTSIASAGASAEGVGGRAAAMMAAIVYLLHVTELLINYFHLINNMCGCG